MKDIADKAFVLKQARNHVAQEKQYDHIGVAIMTAVYDHVFELAHPKAILCKGKVVLDYEDLLRLCNSLADALDL